MNSGSLINGFSGVLLHFHFPLLVCYSVSHSCHRQSGSIRSTSHPIVSLSFWNEVFGSGGEDNMAC